MSEFKTKKMINDVSTCVDDNIEGLVAMNPGLRKVKDHRIIVRSDLQEYISQGKVAILTGGGSGHEPAFGGYVGRGMVTGAVQGDIFASPGSAEVLTAILTLAKNNTAGVFVLYNNYTGDRLNFGIAVEKARAIGIRVTIATNADDCAMVTADKTAGRRGLAGLVLMIKVAGALAEEGRCLEEVTELAVRAGKHIGTLGVCLTPCSIPGMGQLFQVDHDKMELGLGLHGEAGVKSIKMMSAHDTVTTMIDHVINPSNNIRVSISKGDDIALLLNNLGATSDLEMNIVAHESIKYLEDNGLNVTRCYINRYITSQEMAGFSISIMSLDAELLRCLDADSKATVWVEPTLPPNGSKVRKQQPDLEAMTHSDASENDSTESAQVDLATAEMIKKMLNRVCKVLIENKDYLNELDSGCGDGDCGSTLCLGAKAIQEDMDKLPLKCPHRLLSQLACLSEQAMGGSSGALYGLFFTAVAPHLAKDTTLECWLTAFNVGIQAIQTYGGAEPGDRTMLDPLVSAFHAMREASSVMAPSAVLQQAATAAWEGAKATAKMAAHAGRASYVSSEKLQSPDPGAWAVALCIQAMNEVMDGQQ